MKTGIGLQSLRCWVLLTINKEQRFAYRIYALPGHMAQNQACWDTIYTVGFPKQKKFELDWCEILLLEVPLCITCIPTCLPLRHVTEKSLFTIFASLA